MASSLSWRQAVRSIDCSPPQWSARLRRDRLSTHSQCARPRCWRCMQLKDTATREWRVRQRHPLMSTLCKCWFWPIIGSSSLSVTQSEQFCSDRLWRTLLSFNMEQKASLGIEGPICKKKKKKQHKADLSSQSYSFAYRCKRLNSHLSELTKDRSKLLQFARYTWMRLWNCLLTRCRLTRCCSGK